MAGGVRVKQGESEAVILIEDVGRVGSVEDWARVLLPKRGDSFYKLLAKQRGQIETGKVPGENQLFTAFNLKEKDRAAVKNFLAFPLQHSAHAGALLISHNSFADFSYKFSFQYNL